MQNERGINERQRKRTKQKAKSKSKKTKIERIDRGSLQNPKTSTKQDSKIIGIRSFIPNPRGGGKRELVL